MSTETDNDSELSYSAKLVLNGIKNIQCGQLLLTIPNNEQLKLSGVRDLSIQADMQIFNYRGLERIAQRGGIGLFEAYRQGEVGSDDWVKLLHLLAANQPSFERHYYGSFWAKSGALLKHFFNHNTKRQSKKNIHAHYDLSNDFYGIMLDKSMSYSSAIFNHSDEDLTQAQQNKFYRIISKLNIKNGDHILEIGCSWGGFTEYLVANYNVKVTGITLSNEQLTYCQNRFKEYTNVEFLLKDYRDLEQTYDHIVSIEMLEAVGEAYWQDYFNIIQRHLKPQGSAVIQVITMHDKHFEKYRKTTDFIQQYVFPGGMLPSLSALKPIIEESRLTLDNIFLFGEHYAQTLRRWEKRCSDNLDKIKSIGFDDGFIKTWFFYLWYCIAGFEQGRINVAQLLIKADDSL